MVFVDRADAGRRLAARLEHLRGEPLVVLGLPRGGAPVAYEVARALDAPLDVIVVRKLGVPGQPELGMGAIGEGGVRIVNDEVVRGARVSPRQLAAVEARERAELRRRAQRFRGDRPRRSLEGRTAVVVDDGIATGSTARAACRVARALGARRVVLAVPVAPRRWPGAAPGGAPDIDEFVSLVSPEAFVAIGPFYGDFTQTSDEEVLACLDRVGGPAPAAPDDAPAADPVRDEDVTLVAGSGARLGGHVTVPERAAGMVVFVHGSGSSRHSPRNRYVAGVLNAAGLATLLFDLLTEWEEHERAKVFDIELLAGRLADAVAWVRAEPDLAALPLGLFGASTGAAAALWAAAEPGLDIAAVVSRGGRPDLAAARLGAVPVPTLLIVGGRDAAVLALNREAQAAMGGPARLAVVPGAGHLFEEPGTLPMVAGLAGDWFAAHLAQSPHPAA